MNDEKKKRAAKLLAVLANHKPHVYFLLWKKVTTDELIDRLDSKVIMHKRRSKIAVASGCTHRVKTKLHNPLLRIAFNRIKGPNIKKLLRKAFQNLLSNHDKMSSLALHRWKKFVMQCNHKEGIGAVSKNARFTDGFNTLELYRRGKLHRGFRSI